jgi:16S rRNA C967 or C1407 C5-methylase (RsmB/RsmF family)/NOL1/NOP2/fmu family ribosome biogenesis protein
MYPDPFKERLYKQLGEQLTNSLLSALKEDAPTSIRINQHKLDIQLPLEKVSWCNSGYYLSQRPSFVSDPLWHAGAYYVQEASSMALEQAFLKIKSINSGSLSVLDLCAAPGGKSTHLASLLNDEDVLISNEVIQSRVGVLCENISKWGYPNTIITNNDSKDFGDLGEIFDIVVVDAPCSGEGLFRKDTTSIRHWSAENIKTCELRQKRILNEISKAIKPSGFVIYSTCTFNPGENEKQIEFLIQNGFKPLEFEINHQLKSSFQLMPNTHKGEGFFIALLQKMDTQLQSIKPQYNASLKIEKPIEAYLNLIIKESFFIKHKDEIIAVAPHVLEFYNNHLYPLKLKQIGTTIGHLSSSLFFPSDKLVFSQIFKQEALYRIELNYIQALQYLGKQALPFQSSNKGFLTLTYKNINIGLGKFAGNRINNLFPNDWKIRKQIQSSEYFSLLEFKV